MKKAYQETLKTCGAKRGWHWLKPGCIAVLEHFVHQSLPKRNDYIHRHHVLWAFHPGAGPGINTNPALLGLILATLLTVSWVASLSLPSFKLKNVLFFFCVPEHPRGGASWGSWTSAASPSQEGERHAPPVLRTWVQSPWSLQSGHSSCSETAQLEGDTKIKM